MSCVRFSVARHEKPRLESRTQAMSQQILQVDQAMLETTLDRMVRKSVEETLNAMLDASDRRDHRRRALRAQRGAQGVPCRPLRAGPDRQGREDEPQGAETQGRGVLLGGDRTLPTQGGERRRGADRHVPGRREHASGRRCQPAIVGRPHALADPERVFSQVGVSCFVTNFFRFSA